MRSVDGSPARHSSPIIRDKPGKVPPPSAGGKANRKRKDRGEDRDREQDRKQVRRRKGVSPESPRQRAERRRFEPEPERVEEEEHRKGRAKHGQDDLKAKGPFERQKEEERCQGMKDFVLRIGGKRLAGGEEKGSRAAARTSLGRAEPRGTLRDDRRPECPVRRRTLRRTGRTGKRAIAPRPRTSARTPNCFLRCAPLTGAESDRNPGSAHS